MSVHVLKGDDPILRADALEALVTDLLAGDDRSLALEEFTVPGRAREGEVGGEEERRSAVAGAVNAASSPPFMTEGRVVVLRDVGHLLKDEAAPIVSYLEDPMPTTHLVVVAAMAAAAPAAMTTVEAAGEASAVAATPAADATTTALVASAPSGRAATASPRPRKYASRTSPTTRPIAPRRNSRTSWTSRGAPCATC